MLYNLWLSFFTSMSTWSTRIRSLYNATLLHATRLLNIWRDNKALWEVVAVAVAVAAAAGTEANSEFEYELTGVFDRGVQKNDDGGTNESKRRGPNVQLFWKRSTLEY